MTRKQNELIAYLEARSQRRRDTVALVFKAFAVTLVVGVLAILAVRTFLHVTGLGAKTTVNVTAAGTYTTKTPVAIIP